MTKHCSPFCRAFFALCCLTAIPSMLSAHVIEGTGFISGLTHPLSGLEHLFAMIAVGIIGARIGVKALLLIPGTFLISMMIGIGLGFLKLWPSLIAVGISSSLVFFGLLIWSSRNAPFLLTIAGVAFFAFFHGHSHGEELYLVMHPAPYYFGLLLATASLHVAGIAIGILDRKHLPTHKALKLSGIGMCALGLFFLCFTP